MCGMKVSQQFIQFADCLCVFLLYVNNFHEFGSSTSPLGTNFHDWNDWYKET